MTRLFAIGGLTIDWLQTKAGRSGPALGGNAAYAAVGAWMAGADAEVVAVIGDDYPPELLAQLSAAGIGISHVRASPGPSFRVLLDETGPERAISYLSDSGHNDRLDPLPSQLPPLDATDAAHVCAIPTESQRALVDHLVGRAAVVTLDTVIIPGEIEPEADALLELARQVSVFMPSREEVEHHWPGTIERTLEQLAASGLRSMIVKMGPAGSIGHHPGGIVRLPAVPVSARDSTGAGDAYCGAVCARLAAGDALPVAMAWGAAASSVVVEGHGVLHALTTEGRARAATRAAAPRETSTTTVG